MSNTMNDLLSRFGLKPDDKTMQEHAKGWEETPVGDREIVLISTVNLLNNARSPVLYGRYMNNELVEQAMYQINDALDKALIFDTGKSFTVTTMGSEMLKYCMKHLMEIELFHGGLKHGKFEVYDNGKKVPVKTLYENLLKEEGEMN